MTKCLCGGQLEERSVTLDDIMDGQPVHVKGVPALVCRRCGEEYISLDALEQIELDIRSGKYGGHSLDAI